MRRSLEELRAKFSMSYSGKNTGLFISREWPGDQAEDHFAEFEGTGS